MDNQELIRKCIENDRRAQEELFRSYVRAMYNIVFRMVGDRDESEDIVQQAFIKVFSNLSKFEQRSTIGAWIKRIVVNTALTHLNKKERFDRLDEQQVEIEEEEEMEVIPGISIEQVEQAILELPRSARTIVTLHLLEGYKHREIAEQLGIGESSSRSQYTRGRALLRQALLAQMQQSA